MEAPRSSGLDAEIASIGFQISHLRQRRSNLVSVLLSSPHTASILNHASDRPRNASQRLTNALKTVRKQQKRNTENIHRACAGVTAYRVKDPDPHAVDGGRVLGVQIEVFIKGAFTSPYHVLLIRPTAGSDHLRIHKHTIPACIPLSQLAAQYLPQPSQTTMQTSTAQNLPRLIRVLRKELVSYNLRLATVEDLRAEAGLAPTAISKEVSMGEVLNASIDPTPSRNERRRGKISQIEADAAVRELTVKWSSGLIARMKLSKDGTVEKGVARTLDGKREAEIERRLVGRMEGLVQRLREAGT
ncbi:hypothetical protein K432DRAFT_396026 [Lepidopterella palustris CBS 459.81]|uniref:Cenp-O kinetochore centromere component n=1 Tax=Lepidopterella palustris CBS 459.81 TaxID=1314670 RepID=A0A8E2E4C8_9PEZI|nr:hypothetical protein K432DRAFT_396026 [Lepidopterella palustris CBS 459.81]